MKPAQPRSSNLLLSQTPLQLTFLRQKKKNRNRRRRGSKSPAAPASGDAAAAPPPAADAAAKVPPPHVLFIRIVIVASSLCPHLVPSLLSSAATWCSRRTRPKKNTWRIRSLIHLRTQPQTSNTPLQLLLVKPPLLSPRLQTLLRPSALPPRTNRAALALAGCCCVRGSSHLSCRWLS